MLPHIEEPKNNLDDNDTPYGDYNPLKNAKWYDYVLLNRPLRVLLMLFLAAVIGPVLLYQYLFFASLDVPPSDGFSMGSCFVSRTSRLLCGIGNETAKECHPQCCFDLNNSMCFHRFPSRFSYIMDFDWSEEINLKPRVATIPYRSQNSLTSMRLSVDEISSTHLSLTFYNPAEQVVNASRIEIKNYTYHVSSPELNVVVNGSQGPIFNTIRGPLIASNDIWEIAFKLTNETMYGFGEIPIKENTTKIIYSHETGLSGIPLVYAKINESYHGFLIDTVSPTEVEFSTDGRIIVRSITSSKLKFHLFIGPKPEDVMRDVVKLIGINKQLQYWMLGIHICNEMPETPTQALASLRTFISTATSQRMPYDSHCGITPIVFESGSTTQPAGNVNSGATLIRNARKKFLPHISPYIIYEEKNCTTVHNETDSTSNETCLDITDDFKEYFLYDADNKNVYRGFVNDQLIIYPNYDNISVEFMEHLWKYQTVFDGIIIENNWPVDHSYKRVNETHFYLPYFSKNFEKAFNYTPQWNATLANGEKYFYNHNKYGNYFVKAFEKISNTAPIWTASQWMNGDVVINRQNITSSWTSLRKELIEAALGGISGHWLWSSPICGDTDTLNTATQSELCVKWYMAAMFMPMIKIHSKTVPRDPLSFTGTNRQYVLASLNQRLGWLPYFYTTLQSGPLLRPMFYQYPSSEVLKDLISQFNVGNDLLIIPNSHPSQTHVHIWMPPGTWYEFGSGLKINAKEGEAVTMTTTEAEFLTLIRGGSIIATQKDIKLTADLTRLQSDFSLTVAIECQTINITDENGNKNISHCGADGHIFMAPDMVINFEANLEELKITADGNNFGVLCSSRAEWAEGINEIKIYGLDEKLNNYDHHMHIDDLILLCDLEYDEEIIFSFLDWRIKKKLK